MKSLLRTCATIGLTVVATSCVSYSGVSKSPNGDLYISGATNYFVFSTPWVRHCEVEGTKLNCVELTEPSKASTGSTGGTAAPTSSAESPASASPEAPAPEASPAADKPKK
jgi:hypothetical protein